MIEGGDMHSQRRHNPARQSGALIVVSDAPEGVALLTLVELEE
jgi:hypothetical protein